MRLSFLSALLLSAVALAVNLEPQEWAINQTEYTDAVQWDHYSLWVNQQRLVVWSGEFVCFSTPFSSAAAVVIYARGFPCDSF